jgi:pimeloyl-ACP methyl ester carboxylesterase
LGEWELRVEEFRCRKVSEVDIERYGAVISVPPLILHARDDPEVPFSDGQRLHRTIHNSKVKAVNDLDIPGY